MNIKQRAVLIRSYGGARAAEVAEIDKPEAGPGQVLVRVRAAGVNAIDWKVREGYVRDAFPLQLPAVLGIESAGVVEAIGPGVSRFRIGDRVMGPVGGLGAYADFVASTRRNWRARLNAAVQARRGGRFRRHPCSHRTQSH